LLNYNLQEGKTKTQIHLEKKKKRDIEKAEKEKKLRVKHIEGSIADKEESLVDLQNQLCLEEVYSDSLKSEDVNKQIIKIQEEIETASNDLEATLDEMNETKGDSNDLGEKLAEKTAQYEDTFTQFQRLQADFSNYKKRVEKEKSEIYLYANEKIALDLLNIIDNLERAIQCQTDADKDNSLLEGVNLVHKQLVDTLAKHGVEEIETLGKCFDVHLHYAVMQEETDGDPNIVIDVLQKGYKINDRVLRPAMVKVSK